MPPFYRHPLKEHGGDALAQPVARDGVPGQRLALDRDPRLDNPLSYHRRMSEHAPRHPGREAREVGVGPHPEPWPSDPHLDPDLLAAGDRRNVVDRYRYWRVEAIRADLDSRRHPYHVAVENWFHDPNIGAVVRNANAFLAAAVHVVGKRKWNRRGAMMTEVYQHVSHHQSLDSFAAWAAGEGLPLVGVDNLPGSISILEAEIPEACVLLFGQEGPGLSQEARARVGAILHIPQYGSTRSINAGAASAIAMVEWCRRWAGGEATPAAGANIPASRSHQPPERSR